MDRSRRFLVAIFRSDRDERLIGIGASASIGVIWRRGRGPPGAAQFAILPALLSDALAGFLESVGEFLIGPIERGLKIGLRQPDKPAPPDVFLVVDAILTLYEPLAVERNENYLCRLFHGALAILIASLTAGRRCNNHWDRRPRMNAVFHCP